MHVVRTQKMYVVRTQKMHVVRTQKSLSKDSYVYNQYVKVKAIPLQAWTGHEGSRTLRLPDFKTIGT